MSADNVSLSHLSGGAIASYNSISFRSDVGAFFLFPFFSDSLEEYNHLGYLMSAVLHRHSRDNASMAFLCDDVGGFSRSMI